MPTDEQKAQMKGKTCLVLSHAKWNPNGLPGAGVANIIRFNKFMRDNGVRVVLASPGDTNDKVYQQYRDNDLIDDVVFVEVCCRSFILY